MARFAVHDGIDGGPLLLDCQADVFSHFSTRLMVPLLPASSVPVPTRRLHPVFTIGNDQLVMATHLASAVPVRLLGRFVVSLDDEQSRIMGALDMLMCGY